jgi:cell division septation protein DedD/nucleoid DNA-binding protein
MELSVFIKDLLYRHDCVIVPDFGGFVANYRPAAINYNLNTFAPPSKDISFNRSLTNNDGLLIGYISEKTGMSYVDARKWVAGRVKEWKHKLEKGRRVELADIGEFRLGRDRNLLFEPAGTENFLVDAYGLSEFRFTTLEAYDKGRRRTVTVVSHDGKEGGDRRIRRVLIGVPAAAALAALVFIGWNTNLGKERLDLSSFNIFHKKAAVEVTAPATSSLPEKTAAMHEVSVSTPAEKSTSETVPPESAVTAQPEVKKEESTPVQAAGEKPVPTARVQPAGGYYVVAGSFRNQSNAETLKDRLEEAGLPVVIMDGPQGFIRVAIGSYADKSKALAVLREQREEAINGDGYWLLKK